MKALFTFSFICLFLIQCSEKKTEVVSENTETANAPEEKVDKWRRSADLKCGEWCDAFCTYFTDVWDTTQVKVNVNINAKKYNRYKHELFGQYDKKTGKATGLWEYRDNEIIIKFSVINGVVDGPVSGTVITGPYGFKGFYKDGWCDGAWTYNGSDNTPMYEILFKDGTDCNPPGLVNYLPAFSGLEPNEDIDITVFGLEYNRITKHRKIYKPLNDRFTGNYRMATNHGIYYFNFLNQGEKILCDFKFNGGSVSDQDSTRYDDIYFNGCGDINIKGDWTNFETDESGKIYFSGMEFLGMGRPRIYKVVD